MAQNDKQFCLSHSVSQELYIMWLWFLVHMCKMMISPAIFVISQNFDFCSFLRGIKGQKISVCFALYLRSCRSYHQDFDSDIYRCFYLFFKKRCNMVNVKIILLEPRPCPEGSNKIGSVHRSVRPSIRLSVRFLRIGSLVFSET